MARSPRLFMRQGAADLPTRAHVEAYTGPNGEVISDGDTLRLQNGVAPGGIPLISAKTGLSALEDKPGSRRAIEAAAIPNLEVNVKDYLPFFPTITAAFRAAIAVLTARGGGILKVPHGFYGVKGEVGEKYIFRLTVPIIVEGENAPYTQIAALTGTPDDCDIFLWEPTAIGFYYGFRNIYVGPASETQGRNALRIKTSNAAYIENAFIENAWLWGGKGYGIYQEADAIPGAGTIHQMVISHAKLTGALGGGNFTFCGDNFSMHDVGISGGGRGLTIVGGSGTARVVISSLNVRAVPGGAVLLKNCDQLRLIDGQLEQFGTFTGPDSEKGVVVLDNCSNVEVDCSINAMGNLENCILMKNGTRGTRVSGASLINMGPDRYHVTFADDCGGGNVLGDNNYSFNNVPGDARIRSLGSAVQIREDVQAIGTRITRSYGLSGEHGDVIDVPNNTRSWRIQNADRLSLNANFFFPAADNALGLGAPVNRWANIFAQTTVINTSDAREKTEVAALSEAEAAAARDLAREIGGFRFLSSLDKKGDAARTHIGMTVQRAVEIMESHDLDPFGYAFICHDVWPAQEAVYEDVRDENGEIAVERRLVREAVYEVVKDVEGRPTGTTRLVREAVYEPILGGDGKPVTLRRLVKPATPAGDRYGFRTDQLLLFIAAGFEARLSALELA